MSRNQVLRLAQANILVAGVAWLLGSSYHASAQLREQGCAGMINPFVVVEHVQEGFAGRTGERTSIGADGCFTVESVLNGDVPSRLRSGRLRPDQMRDIRATLDAASFASLPERSGEGPAVNPSVMTVTYENTTKTLVAPAGLTVEEVRALGREAQGQRQVGLADLAAYLLELTASDH